MIAPTVELCMISSQLCHGKTDVYRVKTSHDLQAPHHELTRVSSCVACSYHKRQLELANTLI